MKNYIPVAIGYLDNKVYILIKDSRDNSLFLSQVKDLFSINTKNKIIVHIFNQKNEAIDLSNTSNFNLTQTSNGYQISFVQNKSSKNYIIQAIATRLSYFYVMRKHVFVGQKAQVVDDSSIPKSPYIYVGDNNSVSVLRAVTKRSVKIYDQGILSLREHFFDDVKISPISAILKDEGVLLIYDSTKTEEGSLLIQIGGALFSKNSPNHSIWRSGLPLYEKKYSANDEIISCDPLGAFIIDDIVNVFYRIVSKDNEKVINIKFDDPFIKSHVDNPNNAKMKKDPKNPIISPIAQNGWESVATFNPAAINLNDKVHLLYRAQGAHGHTVLGYAVSDDGVNITERLPYPVYVPREDFEGVHSPKQFHFRHRRACISGSSGWGGCEDPRITRIGDTLYLLYVAFNGWGVEPRLAMSTITVEDFLARRWNWTKPELLTPESSVFGNGAKSGVLMSEKINGKFVIFHRIWPNICIDYRDDLNFSSNETWLEVKDIIPPHKGRWDSIKVGVGAPPLKTKYGWLIIYHSVGRQEPGQYKIGAMLLDLNNPSKVLYRSRRPIIEPQEWYEMNGLKGGVAYPCGSVLKDDKVLVYYGAADTVVAVASLPLEEFIKKLMAEEEVIELSEIHLY